MAPIIATVEHMKSMAEMLVPYTYPRVNYEEEQQILCLKQRIVKINGHELVLCFSRADYGKYLLETIQIQSQHAPFLPFAVVCKIGRMFLGERNLCYIDFFRFHRKFYCWAIKVVDGRALSPGKHSDPAIFEGFNYHLLHPGSVDLF
jgi:hypothetical protein